MMNDLNEALKEYVVGVDFAKDEDRSITQENYERVIKQLQEEERKSYGIKKNEQIIKFLRERFE
jgi:hypothetical protein